jgi:protein O-mannosyl-transferase
MAADNRRLPSLLLFAGLAIATLLVYQPAWFGGPLWDDDAHLTRAGLRSWEGLWLIWTSPQATQQYYPLMHSAFWVMQRLWGDAPFGYHAVNILLHASSAFVLCVLLRRLAVPGAAFAAFLFALHPVQVESVAWITELKNTQSTLLYLLAALAYLKFDQTRMRRYWAVAAAFFALALMTKTVTATLPISLLIVLWWKRGSLDWKRDIAPLVPFVVIGVAAGIGTAWVERTFIGASGSGFEFSLVERSLIAGRAVWFYALTLVWPAHLVFTYPRWNVSQAVAWQYVFPAALAGVIVWFWWIRARTRSPLAALLLYTVALGPALGFVNVYPFIYSFVADHFQYTATLPAFAAIASGMTVLARRYLPSSGARVALAAVTLSLLAALTWQQSRQYVSAEVLYRTTIARNPSAWMAHQNLAAIELARPDGDLPNAEAHIRESLRLKPDNAEAHNNLGYLFQRRGQMKEARKEYEEALRPNPGLAAARNNIGAIEHVEGHLQAALEHYQAALKTDRNNSDAIRNLGLVLVDLGRLEEAAPIVEEAFRQSPNHPDALDAMGTLALLRGRVQDAVSYYEAVLKLRPPTPAALVKVGAVYEKLGRTADAVAKYQQALGINKSYAPALDALGYAELRQGQYADAAAHLQEAVRLDPRLAAAHASLGGALQALGRLDESIAAYKRALEFPENASSALVHNAFGVSLAQRGRMTEAIAEFREALRLDPSLQDARANLTRAGAR